MRIMDGLLPVRLMVAIVVVTALATWTALFAMGSGLWWSLLYALTACPVAAMIVWFSYRYAGSQPVADRSGAKIWQRAASIAAILAVLVKSIPSAFGVGWPIFDYLFFAGTMLAFSLLLIGVTKTREQV